MRGVYTTPNDYYVQDGVAHLLLPQDQETLIDLADLPAVLAAGRWCVLRTYKGDCYVMHNRTGKFLHRFLLSAPRGKDVDHKNGKSLDNQRSNLRICTHAQNLQNLRAENPRSISGARNVHWCADKRLWAVRIKLHGKVHHCGSFKDLEEAKQHAVAERRRLYSHATE